MGKILGIAILVGIAYMIFSWKGSVTDIKAACDFATKGKALNVVTNKIQSFGSLRYSDFEHNNKHKIMVHSSASFGRHTCTIEHKDSKVVASEYLFMD